MEKKFVVRITGGLGNQMFQYAFARTIEELTKVDTYIDILDYKTAKRSFGLDNFNIRIKYANEKDRSSLQTKNFKLKRQLKKILGVPYKISNTHYKEINFEYSETPLLKSAPCYFDGLFQSEKYFKSIESELRKEFSFKDENAFKKNESYEKIKSENSVSIHIRCGDYISRAKTKKILYVCKPLYYKRAIDFVKKIIPESKFFIFSDDHNWVKNNLEISDDFIFVNSNSDVEDMYLMSQCKNNIISNSTFSWWAGWLNGNLDKKVISPDIWFTPHAKINFSDIIPSSWTKIETE